MKEEQEEARKQAEKDRLEKERLRIEQATSGILPPSLSGPSTSKDHIKEEKKDEKADSAKVEEEMEISDDLLHGDDDLLLGPDLFGDDILSIMNSGEGGLDEIVSEEKEGEVLDAKDMEDIFNDMIDEEEKKEAEETEIKTEQLAKEEQVQIKEEPLPAQAQKSPNPDNQQQMQLQQQQQQQHENQQIDQIKIEQQHHDQQQLQEQQRQQQQQQQQHIQMMTNVSQQQHHPNLMSPAVPVSSPMPVSIQGNVIMMQQQPIMSQVQQLQQQQQQQQQQHLQQQQMGSGPHMQEHMIQQHQPIQMMQTIMIQPNQQQQPQQIHLLQQQQQQQQQQLMLQRQQQIQRQQQLMQQQQQQQQQQAQQQQIHVMGPHTMVRPMGVPLQDQQQRPMMQQPTDLRPQLPLQQVMRPLPPGAALPAGQQPFTQHVMGVRPPMQQQMSFPQQQQQGQPPQQMFHQQPQGQGPQFSQQQPGQQPQPGFVQSGTWTPTSPTNTMSTPPAGAIAVPQANQPGSVPTPPSDGRPASPEKAPTPTDAGGSTTQRSQLLKWESDEPLGSQATIAMILYANQNHQNLKTDHPIWTERIKQIAKIWKTLPNEKRQPYVQQARENRTANRVGKTVRLTSSLTCFFHSLVFFFRGSFINDVTQI